MRKEVKESVVVKVIHKSVPIRINGFKEERENAPVSLSKDSVLSRCERSGEEDGKVVRSSLVQSFCKPVALRWAHAEVYH